MRITQDVAKTIVNEISNTINKNVNLMDETGRIIASTASDGWNVSSGGTENCRGKTGLFNYLYGPGVFRLQNGN